MRHPENRKPVRRANVCTVHSRLRYLRALTLLMLPLYFYLSWEQPTAAMAPAAAYQDTIDPEFVLPPQPHFPDDKEDLRDTVQHDPELAAIIREEAEIIIASRLAGIPRPRYIPATSLVHLKGLEVYAARNRQSFPFAFYLNGFVQVRWFEFARSVESWTSSTPLDGTSPPTQANRTNPVNNINTFEINRFFLTTEGYVTDRRLLYSLTLFGTTDNGQNSSIAPLGYIAWKFNDQLMMLGGVSFVAGTREWGTSSRWVLGIDRSMANTFFRPSYSPGIEFKGNLLDGELNFRGGVWNGIDGSRAGVNRPGTAMAWAGIIDWQPLGNYGPFYSDMEVHTDPVIRIGCSGLQALSPASEPDSQGNNPEDTIVRLTNGTPIALPGALQPGTSLKQFRAQLATVDAGWKYNGVALNFEYYWRLLNDFYAINTVGGGEANLRTQSIFQQGGAGTMSFCLIPHRLGVYGRSSAVTGRSGTGQEYGGGFNFYPKNNRQAKFTFEALYYNRSPADNSLYPYRAGYSGTAIQTQMLVMW